MIHSKGSSHVSGKKYKGDALTMKKFIALFCAAAVLAFAGMAFAAGHVTPVTPDVNFKPVKVSKDEVEVKTAGVTVEEIAPISVDKANFILGSKPTFYLEKSTNTPVIQAAFTLALSFDHTKAPTSIDVSVPMGDYTGAITAVKAFILASPDKQYNPFPATITTSGDKKIAAFNVTSPEKYFSSADIFLATEKEAPVSGGSSGGCNAGFAGLLLLAAAPLLYFRKK